MRSPNSSRSAPNVEGEVKNKTEFGLFIGLDGDVDGMVHLSDISTGTVRARQVIEEFKKGDMVKAVVLDVDVEKERISSASSSSPATRWNRVLPARSARTPGRHL